MVNFRFHKGSLSDSMETIVKVSTHSELCELLRINLDTWGYKFKDEDIKVEHKMYDERIDWDTYYVTLEGYGVCGMTDGPLI